MDEITISETIKIRLLSQREADDILEVYQQCEDFLALGPEPSASLDMVLKDMESSQRAGGLFWLALLVQGGIVLT